jgi:hypothetical protein
MVGGAVASGKPGTAGGEDHVACWVGDPARNDSADHEAVVPDDFTVHQVVAVAAEQFDQQCAGSVLRNVARV